MSETKTDGRRKYMTVKEVAEHLRISSGTVYQLIQEGELPAKKFGGCVRISRDALAEYEQESEWE